MRYNFLVHQLDKIIYLLSSRVLCIVRLAAIHAMNWNVWIVNPVKTADAVATKNLKMMLLRKKNSKYLKRS